MKLLLRAALALALVATAGIGTASATGIPQIGQIAPNFTIPISTGGKLTFSTLRGHPIYLNFFATWCGPCNVEAPEIGKLYEKYRKRGLLVYGIDEFESAAKANQFRKEHHLAYPALVDTRGIVRDEYAILGLPVHVFIARNGRIALLRFGQMSPREIESAIKSIL